MIGTRQIVDISLVIPVLDEEEILPLLIQRLQKITETLGKTTEWIFVDDGSTDRTLALLRSYAAADLRVKVASLSRNFGHQAAITAGVDLSAGKTVVILDADLQDPPELIAQLYAKYLEGYDVVYAKRRDRPGETIFKRATAALFYQLMKRFILRNLPENVGDFRLMSRRVADTMKEFPEKARFYRGLVTWIGFRQAEILFDRPARTVGTTKFSAFKMAKFALDGVISFSIAPLRGFALAGVAILVLSALFLALPVDLKAGIAFGLTLQGCILIGLAISGEYLGRIYEEAKARPLYVIAELQNFPHLHGKLPSGGLIVAESPHVEFERPQTPREAA